MDLHEHHCNTENFPTSKFLQAGQGLGRSVLIVGEAPANNGWRKSGRAFYTQQEKLLPTGKNLNKLLDPYGLNVEICGFTELIKCYVGKDRHLLNTCGEKCWPIFIKQLRSFNFRLVIILGSKTLEIFNKLSRLKLPMGKLTKESLEGHSYYFLPIFHTSPISPTSMTRNMQIFNSLTEELKGILYQEFDSL